MLWHPVHLYSSQFISSHVLRYRYYQYWMLFWEIYRCIALISLKSEPLHLNVSQHEFYLCYRLIKHSTRISTHLSDRYNWKIMGTYMSQTQEGGSWNCLMSAQAVVGVLPACSLGEMTRCITTQCITVVLDVHYMTRGGFLCSCIISNVNVETPTCPRSD